MALALSPPAAVEQTAAAWLLAPAVRPGAMAWLTVPAALGSADGVAGRTGNALVVRHGTAHVTLYSGGCTAAVDCGTVREPTAGASTFAYAIAPGGLSGYLAAAGDDGRSHILYADESGAAVPTVYAATATRLDWYDGAEIFSRPLDGSALAAPIVARAATGGEVEALAASAAGVAWIARPPNGAAGPDRLFLKRGGAAPVKVEEVANRGLAGLALADDGTLVAVHRLPQAGGQERYDVVTIAPGAKGVRVGLSGLLPARSAPPRPRVSGGTLVFRSRGGTTGTRDVIAVVDLATHARAVAARVDRVSSRLSDPSIADHRIVFTRADLGTGSRLLRSTLFAVIRRS